MDADPIPVSKLIACALGNDVEAQIDLAYLYLNGGPVSRNYFEAYFWFAVTTRCNSFLPNPSADEMMEEIAGKMTGLDVFLAERRAEKWIEKNGAPRTYT